MIFSDDRTQGRVCWWNQTPKTWSGCLRVPNLDFSHLNSVKVQINKGYQLSKPTFFGHYWLNGEHVI